MSDGTLLSLALAAFFTVGCLSIHRARRYPDAVTLGLLLLFGFLGTIYLSQHVKLDGRHPAWQLEAAEPWISGTRKEAES
ncbi:hypothetical protein [Methylobacterium gnaphalii]|uniref:Uncharacterized protein n=1 Tax=Methylobacterium gnaphalii TaxID=1010610 RepID=A0A512JQJ9_9HYPH|nr:hypothetical protein [Methylobacterium gnaphalii]GEP12235.1 hypothetical protein MGN01_40800 [Methylobacterium gnaphalii]GJD70555.1 hypothetical protein MMMDOFMJ_3504 [Methylobacterium gnaphalii]GLS48526.1 hypothetical protein GCM10007885_13700 [Methylobacterium gnaphalii]